MSTFRGQETRCSAEPVINAGQETVMFKKGINMIPGLGFRCFGILIVGLAGLMSAACFAAEPAGGKKFSLVYLVDVESRATTRCSATARTTRSTAARGW